MALLPNASEKRTRFRLVEIAPRGTLGAGNEPSLGSGGDQALTLYVPQATQTVDAMDIYAQPVNAAPVKIFSIDAKGNIGSLSGVPTTMQAASVALSAANIMAMYATPVQLIAAPGAGLAILVDSVHIEYLSGGTAFAAGGAIDVQYGNTNHGGGTAVHSSTLSAGTINSTTTSYNLMPPSSSVISVPANTGIYISNATAAFTTGNGQLIVTLWYSVLTLT